VIDKTGVITYINKAWKDFAENNDCISNVGVGVNYLSVLKLSSEIEGSVNEIYDNLIKVINRESSYYYLDYSCHSPTEQRWFSMRVTPIGENGEVVISHSNITERVFKEEELQIINDKFNIVISGTNTGLWEWNLQTNDVIFNAEWGAQLGYKYEDIIQEFSFWEKLVHPDDIAEAKQRIEAYLLGNNDEYDFVLRMKHKDGEWKHILTKGVISKIAEDGTPLYFMGTHTDVNKEEQYLQEISEYEKYFSISTDLMCVVDEKGYFLNVNNKFIETLGFSREELTSTPFSYFIHEDDLEETMNGIKEIVDGNPKIIYNRYKCKEGGYRSLMWITTPDEKRELWYSSARDITDLIKAQEKSQQYFNILNNSLNEMYVIDAETFYFLDANIGAQKNLGYTLADLKKHTVVELNPELNIASVKGLVKPLVNKEEVHVSFEAKHYRKDGTTYNAFVNVQLTQLDGRDVFIALALDITKRIEQEQELKIAKTRLSNIIDYANVGIAYANEDAEVIAVNKKFADILEYKSEDELIGKKVADFTFPADLEEDLELVREIKEGKRDTFQLEKRYITKLNNIRWIDLNVSTIRNEFGEVVNFVAMVIDITEKKESQEKLIKAENERYLTAIKTEENERQRISQDLHDGLGQTIAAASLYINTLDDLVKEQLDEETYAIFKTGKDLVSKSAKETRMVSHNIMPPSLNQFGLNESLSQLIGNYQKINNSVKILYTSNIKDYRFKQELELSLYRIVQELINNAYKHSKATNINVSIDVFNKTCKVVVKDDGIGFNYDEIKNNKETGIGLMNIEQRVLVFGGQFQVQEQGKGVEFVIFLDL
jgi:PAS domain S-box-containing protein